MFFGGLCEFACKNNFGLADEPPGVGPVFISSYSSHKSDAGINLHLGKRVNMQVLKYSLTLLRFCLAGGFLCHSCVK